AVSLLSGCAVADLRQIGAIAGDETGTVAGRTVTGYDDNGLELLQPVEDCKPVPKARMRARKGRLSAHGEVAGEQDVFGLNPDDRITERMVRAYGCEFRMHATEIEVVIAVERDVRLPEIRVLEQLGIDWGTAGEHLGELQAGLGDLLHLVDRTDQRRR